MWNFEKKTRSLYTTSPMVTFGVTGNGDKKKYQLRLNRHAIEMILGTENTVHVLLGYNGKQICLKRTDAEDVNARCLERKSKTKNWDIAYIGHRLGIEKTTRARLTCNHADLFVLDFSGESE